MHMLLKSWHISWPFSAKQREMTKFCVFWTTWTTTANFRFFYLQLNTLFTYSSGASSKPIYKLNTFGLLRFSDCCHHWRLVKWREVMFKFPLPPPPPFYDAHFLLTLSTPHSPPKTSLMCVHKFMWPPLLPCIKIVDHPHPPPLL